MSKHQSKEYHYIGLDVHKKTVVYCIKKADGKEIAKGYIHARVDELQRWASKLDTPWIGGMEATMFSAWVYDVLKPYAADLKVGDPQKMELISKLKKKSDEIDASKIADMLRVNLFPEIYMAPANYRELKSLMRYRNMLVRVSTKFKNRMACRLMESGIEYNASKLHYRGYFKDLMSTLTDMSDEARMILRLSRSEIEFLKTAQRIIEKTLMENSEIRQRCEYLMSIAGVGTNMSLTWVCEIGEIKRFTQIKKLISYCGLCSSFEESAGKQVRTPISKKRNKYLQTMLIEVAKLAPRFNPDLAKVYDAAISKGCNHNEATLAVARKLVAYMFAVDRDQRAFVTDSKKSVESV
jgi:transposase